MRQWWNNVKAAIWCRYFGHAPITILEELNYGTKITQCIVCTTMVIVDDDEDPDIWNQ